MEVSAACSHYALNKSRVKVEREAVTRKNSSLQGVVGVAGWLEGLEGQRKKGWQKRESRREKVRPEKERGGGRGQE